MRERVHPIHFVIVTLLVTNLAVTMTLLVRNSLDTKVAPTNTQSLPAALTSAERARLFSNVQERFNARDPALLYATFDEFARAQMSESDLTAQLSQLNGLFGSIKSGVYSHFEYAGAEGERSFFKLFYNVKYSSLQFPAGRATITVTSDGSTYGLVAFNLTAGLQ